MAHAAALHRRPGDFALGVLDQFRDWAEMVKTVLPPERLALWRQAVTNENPVDAVRQHPAPRRRHRSGETAQIKRPVKSLQDHTKGIA